MSCIEQWLLFHPLFVNRKSRHCGDLHRFNYRSKVYPHLFDPFQGMAAGPAPFAFPRPPWRSPGTGPHCGDERHQRLWRCGEMAWSLMGNGGPQEVDRERRTRKWGNGNSPLPSNQRKNLRTNQSLFFQDTHEKCIDLFLCSLAQKSATQKQCIHHYVLIFEWCQVILDLKPRFQSFPVSPNIISPWLYHTQTIVCHLSRYIYIYIWFASSGLAQRWHFTYTHIPVARSIIYWHFSAPVVMSIHKFLQMPDASETICLLIFKHPQGCFFKSTWYTSRRLQVTLDNCGNFLWCSYHQKWLEARSFGTLRRSAATRRGSLDLGAPR